MNLIKYPQDIFSLDFEKIISLEGWGSLSVNNLKKSISKSRDVNLDKFIFSLGIRHIGQENAKLIAEHLKTANNFLELKDIKKIDNLQIIDGIGETQIKSLTNFFKQKINLKVLNDLLSLLNIKTFRVNQVGKVLNNKIFMFTGKLENISRAEAKSLVEQNGGKILSSISKKLDYLVVGDKPTNKKIDQAKKNNIKVISQKDFETMLNRTQQP